jgi:transcription factor SPN1
MADLEEEIFGADSDEEFNNQSSTNVTSTAQQEPLAFEDDADDLFGDSDDDPKSNKKSRGGKLKKTGKAQIKNKGSYLDENLMDSDEEVDEKKGKRLNQKDSKKRKRSTEKKDHGGKKSKPSEDKGKDDVDSGDEYDSGQEVVETQDDRDFIDEDDDQLDLRKEYDDDLQDFDDERPDKSSKKKSKPVSQSSSSYTPKTKDLDPLSQTLNEIRKPKVKALSDAEKDVMVEKLLRKMAQAAELDDECFKRKEPSLHKVQLLPTVQRAVAMKSLHNTLLEKDFLCYLRDWIEPKSSSSLPALSLRTSVYEMLLKLPCMTEHLKRGNDKVPIGYVIVALRKHKMETPENKRLLKEIMDKWSRPIFSKTDGSAGQILENEEVKTALLRKYSEPQSTTAPTQNNSGNFQSLISGENNQKKDIDTSRARAPSSYGYLFTVQPELKQLDKRNVMEKSLGEERMKLFKKTVEGGKTSSTGKKANVRYVPLSFYFFFINACSSFSLRAMTISVSGNNLKH